MARKLIFLIIILGIAGVAVAASKIYADRTPKQGVLKVVANPVVTIFLDNRHVGRSPYEDKVDEGEYTLKISPESSVQSISSWQGKVKITRNQLTFVNANLGDSEFNSSIDILWLEKITSRKSEVSLVTNPDGAMLTFDGQSKGATPVTVTDVEPGEHMIDLASPGFAVRNLKVKTTAGFKLLGSVKMALVNQFLESPTPQASPTAEATSSAIPRPTGRIKTTVSPTPRITSRVTATPTPTRRITPTPTVQLSGTPKPTQPDPEKPFIIISETPTGFLRVRADATTASAEMGQVNPGEKYSIIDTREVAGVTWYKITFNGTDDGWVSGRYAEKVE